MCKRTITYITTEIQTLKTILIDVFKGFPRQREKERNQRVKESSAERGRGC